MARATAQAQQSHTTPVRLVVWGLTPADRELAEAKARRRPGSHRWEVRDVEQADMPINRPDWAALDQDAHYGWAWAVYPAGTGPSGA
jgi:hypothetical protein